MIAANSNYSLFVLERLANEAEILQYNIAVQRKLATSKRMTNMTIIRELFGCGSGKGGVLQSVGKETEYLPKLLLDQDNGELLQVGQKFRLHVQMYWNVRYASPLCLCVCS